MNLILYNKWLDNLSITDKIKYFISLLVNSQNTKLDKFGGFETEVSDYRSREIEKKSKQHTEKKNYDIEVKKFGLENCRKKITDYYSKLTKQQLKKLEQYTHLPTEIKRNNLSRELLIMALVTYHISIYRIREQFYSTNKSYITSLKKGTKFYHGRFAYNSRAKKRKYFIGETWLSRDKHNSFSYASQANDTGSRLYDKKGITLRDDYEWFMYVFKATKDLKLLNINLQTVKIIKDKYPYMIPIIEFIFPIEQNNEEILCRNSIIEYDYVFSLFVCHILKLDGYLAACFTNFQEEEMLCNIESSLTKPVVYMWRGKTVNNWLNNSFNGKLKPNEKIALVRFYQQFASFE